MLHRLWSYVICFVKCHVVYGRLLVEPKDTEVVIGESAVFNCTTSEPYSINWQHRPLGSTRLNIVYTARVFVHPYHMRYKIDGNQTKGEYNLVITNLISEDAGTFFCTDEAGQGIERSAELILLESPLICESNLNSTLLVGENDCGVEPDVVRFKCKLKYRGNIAPELKWKTTNNKSVTPLNSIVEKQPNQVTTEIALIPNVDGQSVTCETTLSRHSWTSETLKVLSVSNITQTEIISKEKSEFCLDPNNNLSCNHRWIKETEHGSEIVSLSQYLTIDSPGLYTCLIECSLRKSNFTFKAMHVYFIDSGSNKCPAFWSVLIVSIVILFLYFVTTIFIIRKIIIRKKKKNYIKHHKDLLNNDFKKEKKTIDSGFSTKSEYAGTDLENQPERGDEKELKTSFVEQNGGPRLKAISLAQNTKK